MAAQSEQSFDVAVLGGGAIGLAVAWRARQRGASVAVLDAGPLGGGASSVAAGMLAPVAEADAGERALLALGLDSARRWPSFAQELAESTGVDVGLRANGTLVVARDRDEAEALEREHALRERLGVRVERLLPSAARRLEPALTPTLRAALLAPDDHSVDPRALVAALALAAERSGVVLLPSTPVARVEPGRGVVLADGSRVHTEEVVVALGAWSGGLDGLPPIPVRPVKGQTIRLRGPAPAAGGGGSGLLDRAVRYDGGYLVPRGRSAGDGRWRVVLGATVEERGFDTAMTAGGVYELLRDAAELVPGVLELEVEAVVAGLRPGTPDNAPLLGRLAPGVVLATGHFRNGILLAPVTAELVAAELAGEPVAHAFGPARFDRVAQAA